MPSPILSVQNLRVLRSKQEILHGISFSIEAGDFVAIVGKNGAGKTTLLKSLCRILPVDSGDIEIRSRSLTGYKQRELARHLSYLPQADGQVPPVSVGEYVLMGRYPYLSPFASLSAADLAAAQTAMERAGVAHLAARNLKTLSGGERQKALIAAALAQGAEILLLDEPGSFLDPKHQVDVYTTLQHLNQAGVTVVMVTHDLNSAARYANSILALKEGEVAYAGSREAFILDSVLEQVFDVSFQVIPVPGSDASLVLPEARP